MATKAQQEHAAEQRHAASDPKRSKRPSRSKPGTAPKKRSRLKKRTERKATYAIEAPREGRPSRKSTRKSANRSKPDTNFNLREQQQKGSPEARFRKSRARTSRVRGSA